MIGAAGKHIKELAAQSGAKVRLNSKEEAEISRERIMTIIGSVDDICKCISLVVSKLLEDSTVGTYQNMSVLYTRPSMPLMQFGGAPVGQSTNGGLPLNGAISAETLSATTVIQMSIPDDMIRYVIGKKGATISEIQSLSGAKVNVSGK